MSQDAVAGAQPCLAGIDPGKEIYALASELYPVCRSITGDGVRTTLDILERHIPLERHELPTGTKVLDWEIPREWNIADAYIKDADGNRQVDFRQSNLHVLNYCTPIHRRMDLDALRPHIFTLPDQPELIPYRTSYYADAWGFCMSQNQLAVLDSIGGEFEVCIDSTLEDGALTWGEYLHRGEIADEILLSTHICHPSLANDNCSGLALQTILAKLLSGRTTRYSYRFLFVPGTRSAQSLGFRRTMRPCSTSSMAWCCPASATRAGPPTRRAAAAMRRSTGPWAKCSTAPASSRRSSTSFLTVTTSGNIVRPVSICPSACSSGANSERFPSTTPPRTICRSSRPPLSASRSAGSPRPSTSSSASRRIEPQSQGRAATRAARPLCERRR